LQSGGFTNDDQKIAARRDLRARLRSLSPGARATASQAVGATLIQFFPCPAGRVVAGFLPLPSEPDLTGFYHHWRHHGGHLAMPLITGHGQMEFRLLPANEPAESAHPDPNSAPPSFPGIIPGPHGLYEPDPTRCELAATSEISLVLVPGLGFAAGGLRLGRGGGYYDRWLAHLPSSTQTIGITFSIQICPSLPTLNHDQKVDFLLTESGWSAGNRGQPPITATNPPPHQPMDKFPDPRF
jgi:5-formyltetrahydrofolate cyclo-ligase